MLVVWRQIMVVVVRLAVALSCEQDSFRITKVVPIEDVAEEDAKQVCRENP